jgi:hypothetical protein
VQFNWGEEYAALRVFIWLGLERAISLLFDFCLLVLTLISFAAKKS